MVVSGHLDMQADRDTVDSISILHDIVYQSLRNYGCIVYVGPCNAGFVLGPQETT